MLEELLPETYFGFELYFPDIGLGDTELINQRAFAVQPFLKRIYSNYTLLQIEKDRSFILDYEQLLEDNVLKNAWSTLKVDLINNSAFSLKCIGLSMHFMVYCNKQSIGDVDWNSEVLKKIPIIRARLVNYQPVLQLKDVKSHCYGKLLAVEGTVINVSAVNIMCEYMAYSCYGCKELQVVKLDGTYSIPNKCLKHCNSKSKLEPQHQSGLTRTIRWQSIRLQENKSDMATIPQTLNCELNEDLVKSCLPGDFITVVGIVKVRDLNDNCGKNKQNSMFTLYLDATSTTNHKNQNGGIERITLTTEDYYTVKQIHDRKNVFSYLVNSLCPSIYGHEIVKAGLVLALFKGSESPGKRAESHVLLVGDPGLGKSQMLISCASASPRGIYVCGNTSTGSGLTVTMTRECGGEYSLDAGALILSDGGCCCVDEFDKMPTQHSSLLEAMEQQNISLAKAGLVCSIPTKPTVIVAANPSGGHYSKAKTVSENLKIGSPMLSRFDLIFILTDTANEKRDELLSKHVFSCHNRNTTNKLNFAQIDMSEANNGTTLLERLQLQESSFNPLSHNLFRKYIVYAQTYVNPHLCKEAKDALKTFYLELRKHLKTGDSTPVTTRQWYSLIRLTQARAKLELCEEAKIEHALDVIEIVKQSLADIFSDETGELDFTRSQSGTGMSKKKKIMRLLQVLQRKSELQGHGMFAVSDIRNAAQEICITQDFNSVMDTLNIQGYVLKKGNSQYQLNSAYL